MAVAPIGIRPLQLLVDEVKGWFIGRYERPPTQLITYLSNFVSIFI